MSKKIILVKEDEETFEAFGSLTEVCRHYSGLKYWTLARLNFPIEVENLKIFKVNYNKSKIN